MSGNIAEINRKLSVFLYCHVFRPDFEVYLGVIGPAELNGAIRFKSHPRTSGLNRKLSVFRDSKEISCNLRIKTDVIRDPESDDVISFEIHPSTSGFYRF